MTIPPVHTPAPIEEPPRRTALLWKSRVSRKRKAEVTETVRKIYPDATDQGAALEMTVPGSCYKDVWIFLFCRAFRDIKSIEAAGRSLL